MNIGTPSCLCNLKYFDILRPESFFEPEDVSCAALYYWRYSFNTRDEYN